MVVSTRSERVINARKVNLELLWGKHNNDCLTCEKAGACKLQDYCYEYGVSANEGYEKALQSVTKSLIRFTVLTETKVHPLKQMRPCMRPAGRGQSH